jgi:hypothetical protein
MRLAGLRSADIPVRLSAKREQLWAMKTFVGKLSGFCPLADRMSALHLFAAAWRNGALCCTSNAKPPTPRWRIAQIERNPYHQSVERVSPAFLIDTNSVNQIPKHGERRSMRINSNFAKVVMLATALLMMSFTVSSAKTNVDYKFKVHNNAKLAIKKIQVSEDGKKWGYFDIGDGIAAGATDELVWDKSTDEGNCEWYFKAVWSDGEESDAAKFDFCEKALVIEFTK